MLLEMLTSLCACAKGSILRDATAADAPGIPVGDMGGGGGGGGGSVDGSRGGETLSSLPKFEDAIILSSSLRFRLSFTRSERFLTEIVKDFKVLGSEIKNYVKRPALKKIYH
jgi:hypothetical protein